MPPLLQVKDLRTYFFGFRGTRVVKAVDGVSFTLEAGETMGHERLSSSRFYDARANATRQARLEAGATKERTL